MQATYIEVRAGVRYWEYATINGTTDTDGTLTQLRKGDNWEPVIRLADGMVMDWPQGTTGDVHFKVCDAGEYWLLDDERKRIADIETEIESRAWHFAPADRAKLERARRMLTNAALTALTGSPQEENSK